MLPQALQLLVDSGRLPPALLLVGRDASGLRSVAEELALLFLGNAARVRLQKGLHPDFQLIKPHGRLHALEEIQVAIRHAQRPPFEAPYSFFVIEEAERLSSFGAHALLKTLEEMPPQSIFLLLTAEPDGLLPTLLARLRRVFCPFPHAPDEKGALQVAALLLAPSEGARLEQMLLLEKSCEGEEVIGERASQLLGLILTWFRDLELLRAGHGDALHYPVWREALEVYLHRMPHPVPLERLLERIDCYQEALRMHVKLRACLQALMDDLSQF